MDKYYVPQYLDEPYKIILWTLDEFIVFMTPFLILLLFFNQVVLGVVLGSVLVFAIKKVKGKFGSNFFYSLIYWHLPSLIRFKSTPPSHYREFIG